MYSISFCTDKNWIQGLVGSAALITSILNNTKCKDIYVVIPNKQMSGYLKRCAKGNNVKTLIRENPVLGNRCCHKLPAFDYEGKRKLFVDTHCLFFDDVEYIFDYMDKNNIDIMTDPVADGKGYEENMNKYCNYFNVNLPKKMSATRTNAKTYIKRSTIIFLNDVKNFSNEWSRIARELRYTLGFKSRQIDQLSLTLAIETLGLKHEVLPDEIRTVKLFGFGEDDHKKYYKLTKYS